MRHIPQALSAVGDDSRCVQTRPRCTPRQAWGTAAFSWAWSPIPCLVQLERAHALSLISAGSPACIPLPQPGTQIFSQLPNKSNFILRLSPQPSLMDPTQGDRWGRAPGLAPWDLTAASPSSLSAAGVAWFFKAPECSALQIQKTVPPALAVNSVRRGGGWGPGALQKG